MNRTYVSFEPLMEPEPYVSPSPFYSITWNTDYLELPVSEAERQAQDAIHQEAVRRNRWILDA